MSKAAELAALIGSQSALSNRNLIINGSMQVAQRGTSATSITTAGYYTVDRIKPQFSSLGTWTIEQSTDAPDGFSNSIKMTATTADASPSASDYAQVIHRIEAQNLQHLQFGKSSAKSTTLSFYVKATKTGSFTLVARTFDTSTRMFSKNITVSSANTWEYKTVTIPADTGGDIANDNGVGIEIAFWFNAGSTFSGGSEMSTWAAQVNANKYLGTIDIGASTNDAIQFTGLQLEIGEQATPFEHRSFGDDLSACQRYFTKSYNQGTAVATATVVGSVYKVMDAAMNYGTENVVFPRGMRATPTVGIYSPVTGALGKFDSNTSGGTTDLNLVAVNIGDHGFSGQSNNQAVGQNAYMRWHYTADAEL